MLTETVGVFVGAGVLEAVLAGVFEGVFVGVTTEVFVGIAVETDAGVPVGASVSTVDSVVGVLKDSVSSAVGSTVLLFS